MTKFLKFASISLSVAFAGLLIAAIFLPIPLRAQVSISTTLPNQSTTAAANEAPGTFLNAFYTYALSISGVLAFGVIVFGGVKYMVSTGNPSATGDAKEWIKAALLGLLMLAGAFIILWAINPALTNLALPQLGVVAPVAPANPPSNPPGGPITTGTCPMPALPTLTDPQAIAMENGQTIVVTASNPSVQANLNRLVAALSRMQAVMSAQHVTMTVTSVYRPLQYQELFYAIYTDQMQMNGDPSIASNAGCSTLVSQLQAEEQKHGICLPGKPCLVAKPTGCGDHQKGIGVDIKLPQSMYVSINAILSANNIDLRWASLPGDVVHFHLTDPVSNACVTS